MNTQRHVIGEIQLPLPDRATGLSGASYFEAVGQLAKASIRRKAWSDLWSKFDWFLYVGVRNARSIQAHNEESFRYLLANEGIRAERSGCSFQVLLAYFTSPNGSLETMENDLASKLFLVLSRSLRETDHIGWYRDGHIIGGVLTALGDCPAAGLVNQIEQRLAQALESVVLGDMVSRFRVHIRHYHEIERVGPGSEAFTLS